jgi:hypothetical protein
VKTLAIGFAWLVSLLSGIVTIFALFGGQQWLEANGWTLNPNVQSVEQTTETASVEATGGEETATSDPTPEATTPGATADPGDGGDRQDNTLDRIAAVSDWLIDTGEGLFDTWLVAFISVVILTTFALTSGVLTADAYWNFGGRRFFDVAGVVLLASIAVYFGFIVGAIDPGWIAWYIIASVLAGFVGWLVADGANY